MSATRGVLFITFSLTASLGGVVQVTSTAIVSDDSLLAGIEFTEARSIGDVAGNGMLCYRRGLQVAVALDGSAFVSSGCDCRIQAFDPTGQFVTSAGTCGEGPGELTEIEVVAAHDKVFVGGRPGRILVYSRMLELEGEFAVGAGSINSAIALPNGNLVLNQHRVDDTGLYEYTSTGERIRSFVTAPLRSTPPSGTVSPGLLGFFALTTDSESNLWAARMTNSYTLARWEGSRRATQIAVREADWYEAYSTAPSEGEGHPMIGPRGLGWSRGLIWVLLQRPRTGPPTGSSSYEFVVEAIDTSRARIIAQAVIDQGFSGWVGDKLWRVEETDGGGIELTLYSVEFSAHRPGGTRSALEYMTTNKEEQW